MLQGVRKTKHPKSNNFFFKFWIWRSQHLIKCQCLIWNIENHRLIYNNTGNKYNLQFIFYLFDIWATIFCISTPGHTIFSWHPQFIIPQVRRREILSLNKTKWDHLQGIVEYIAAFAAAQSDGAWRRKGVSQVAAYCVRQAELGSALSISNSGRDFSWYHYIYWYYNESSSVSYINTTTAVIFWRLLCWAKYIK